jgi:hypothetical protein
MKIVNKTVLLFLNLTIFSAGLCAQNAEPVTVIAGTRVLDYFPLQVRYRYPTFLDGKVVFKNGNINLLPLNYNILLGEIEFIKSKDTLAIVKKKDISYVTISKDTFLYDDGYLEIIRSGKVRVGLKHYVKLKDVLKKGAFGTTARSTAVDSYMRRDGNSFSLIPDEDIVLQETKDFFIARSGDFVLFRKKNVMQLFPEYAENIKTYLKTVRIDFETTDDLLKFADFLNTL